VSAPLSALRARTRSGLGNTPSTWSILSALMMLARIDFPVVRHIRLWILSKVSRPLMHDLTPLAQKISHRSLLLGIKCIPRVGFPTAADEPAIAHQCRHLCTSAHCIAGSRRCSASSSKRDKPNRNAQSHSPPGVRFSEFTGCCKGKHAAQYLRGTDLVLLDPDVAKVFRDDATVNEALRTLINTAARLPRKTA